MPDEDEVEDVGWRAGPAQREETEYVAERLPPGPPIMHECWHDLWYACACIRRAAVTILYAQS